MKVIDHKNSEHGKQRRLDGQGRQIHCCCICGYIGRWTGKWSWFGSDLDLDEGRPIAKFCSDLCKAKAGDNAENVTTEMLQTAKDAEWREPRLAYREATEAEKYRDALSKQQGSR